MNAGERARKIAEVVADCQRRRAAGEVVADEALIAAHPELMPALSNELRKLAFVQRAAARAAQTETAAAALPGSVEILDARDEMPPDLIPGYRLIREVHRGGQGVVYQAIQASTQRKVAIKVMKEGPFAGSLDKARFDREVQILGQLNHPNIVAIHDSGTAAGSFYFVMNYVSGQPLDAYVEQSKPDMRRALGLFGKVCEAVNAAHLRGIIHRDLKPGNIRVDHDGTPHVLDFGLAKTISEVGGAPMTMTGQFVGSLPWASPEQAEGVPGKIDIRTDVYALGVILYQMLTGRFPYEVVGNMRDVLDNILRAAPARPSTFRRQINDEVETIVLKCLSKERKRRYQSAGELARDVERYLAGEPIEAKRDSGWYVLRKQMRRYRAPVAIVAGAVLMIAVLGGVSFRLYTRAESARGRALRALANEEAQNHTARLALREIIERSRDVPGFGASGGGAARDDVGAPPVERSLPPQSGERGLEDAQRPTHEPVSDLADAARQLVTAVVEQRDRAEAALAELSRLQRARNLDEWEQSAETQKLLGELLLSQHVGDVDFQSVPLGDFLEWIATAANVNPIASWQSLDAVGVSRESRVSAQLPRATVREALDAVVNSLGDDRVGYSATGASRVRGNVLVLTTLADLRRPLTRLPGDLEDQVYLDEGTYGRPLPTWLFQVVPEASFEAVPAELVIDWISATYPGAAHEVAFRDYDPHAIVSCRARSLRLSQLLWMLSGEIYGGAAVAYFEADRLLYAARRVANADALRQPRFAALRASPQAIEFATRISELYAEEPQRLDRAAWNIVHRPGGDLLTYRPALRMAQAACMLTDADDPVLPTYEVTLAAAQFRVGDPEIALATLGASAAGDETAGRLVRILCLHATGASGQALAVLTKISESPTRVLRAPALQCLLEESVSLLLEPEDAKNALRSMEAALQKPSNTAETNAVALNDRAWRVVSNRTESASAYAEALGWAQVAAGVWPENGAIRDTLGVAQYRVGAYEDALRTLTRADHLIVQAEITGRSLLSVESRTRGRSPSTVAFHAMTLQQLGRRDEALQRFEQLRTLVQRSLAAGDAQSRAIFHEAEELLGVSRSAPAPRAQP